MIRQTGREKKSKKSDEKKKIFYFFFQFNSKNFLRGRKFRWGVFKGARGGGAELKGGGSRAQPF